MQGTIRKRGSTWSYQFFLGIIDGKKKYKAKGGFKTKGEATKALNEAIYEFENSGYVAPKKISFEQFTLQWLNEYVKPLRKITTYNRYNELAKKYLFPTLGMLNIIDIKAIHIEKILIQNKDLISGATLQSIYTLVNTIMTRALKLRIIKDNPCKYIERPKRDKFVPNTLIPEEISLIINSLNLENEYDYMFYIAIRLILELGLRRGELSGLEWNNLNVKENTIKIKNNMIYSNGHVIVTTPKTLESIREIYISDDLLNILKILKKNQSRNKLSCGEFYEKNIFNDREFNFIMRWRTGKYIHPMYYTNKFSKILNECKINKKVRFHDLRHTNATLLLQQGINPKVIQERLGHKDIGTTLNIYSHVNINMQKKATDSINDILNFGMSKECQK